jgi:hypothetical protein
MIEGRFDAMPTLLASRDRAIAVTLSAVGIAQVLTRADVFFE